MTVLIKAVAGANTYYLTPNNFAVVSSVSGSAQNYLPQVVSIDPLNYELSGTTGGYVRLNFGGFALLPDFATWPLPRVLTVTIYKQFQNQLGVITSEAAILSATAVCTSIGKTQIDYQVYDKVHDVDLLDAAPDLGGVTNRVYPLAIGVVNLVQPLQVGSAVSDYEYHKAGIVETTPGTGVYHIYDNEVEKTLTIDDKGATFQSILIEVWLNGTSIESGITDGDLVTVAGTGTPTDYAGLYIVTDTRTNGVRVRLRVGQGYDNYTSGNTLGGVSITSVDSIPGKPVGTVLTSGTGADTTLIDVFDWAKSRINTVLGTSYTLDSTKAGAVTISGFETQQQNIKSFLMKLTEQTNHLFSIDEVNAVIHLVDMQTDNGTLSLDEYQYFSGEYRYPSPIRTIIYNWEDLAISTDDQGYPVITTQYQSQRVYLDAVVGQDDFQCPVYSRVVADIEDLLVACGTSIQAPITSVKVPFQTGIVPGLKITTSSDSKMYDGATGVSLRVRTIQYDFENETITATGHVVA